MRRKLRYVAPPLAIATLAVVLALTPSANAEANPDVPYGGNMGANSPALQRDPSTFGVHADNHDEVDRSAGSYDVPF